MALAIVQKIQLAQAVYPTSGTTLSVTMGVAPTNGNLLLAICPSSSQQPNNGTGWTQAGDVAGTVRLPIFWKKAGVSEPTTQSPVISNVVSQHLGLAVYEISGFVDGPAAPNFTLSSASNNSGTSGAPCVCSLTTTQFTSTVTTTFFAGAIAFIVGGVNLTASTISTTPTGYTNDFTDAGSATTIADWYGHQLVSAAGTSVNANIAFGTGTTFGYAFVVEPTQAFGIRPSAGAPELATGFEAPGIVQNLATTGATGTGTTALSWSAGALPTLPQPGNTLLAGVAITSNTILLSTPSVPAGWTLIGVARAATGGLIQFFAKSVLQGDTGAISGTFNSASSQSCSYAVEVIEAVNVPISGVGYINIDASNISTATSSSVTIGTYTNTPSLGQTQLVFGLYFDRQSDSPVITANGLSMTVLDTVSTSGGSVPCDAVFVYRLHNQTNGTLNLTRTTSIVPALAFFGGIACSPQQSITDSAAFHRTSPITATDTGPTETDSPSLQGQHVIRVTDTAATETDSPALQGQHVFSGTDTAATETDSPVLKREVTIAGTDTAATETDSPSMHGAHVIAQTDTAATVSDSAALKGQHVIHATDTAASESDSPVVHVTRAILGGDTAATISDTPVFRRIIPFSESDTAATITDAPDFEKPLTVGDASQTHHFQLQVWRGGVWVDVPVQSAQGNVQKGQAGQMSLVMPNDLTDPYRSRLFEGEKVRAYRGIIGKSPVRCWTGYVDAPTATDQVGVSRTPIVTDYIKELNDAIVLEGVIYDNITPNAAIADVIQKAINTGQLVITDDVGATLSTTASYSVSGGNPLLYFPDYINPDGSLLTLASGSLGSFTSGNSIVASFMVPIPAQGAAYCAFELAQQYLIASTMTMYGFGIASSSGTTLPPPVGSTIVDFYNGVFYFNPADASTTASFSAFYYNAPLWAYAPGASCADVISAISDKVGARWSVDSGGKFYSRYLDTTKAPSKVFGRGQYGQLQVQANRDRRNVIICEGWDGNCGVMVAAKCVNWDDINNAPPIGLGKRTYTIIQDPSWKSRPTINNAVYYAAQQIGRRGKVLSAMIVDDPTIVLEDVLCFSGATADVTEGEFFYVEGINWEFTVGKNGSVKATNNITATSLPGQGTFYLGPGTAMTANGAYDFSQDIRPMRDAALNPTGGTLSSTFSIAGGLTLTYEGLEAGDEQVDIYGADGSHLGPFAATRTGGLISLVMPVGSMTPFVWYVVRLRYEDSAGNLGIYRDFIMALP